MLFSYEDETIGRFSCLQRSYEIINESYFCVRHKNKRKHNQYSKTAVFLNKFLLCHIKPNSYIQKTKFASQKQYLFCLLTSRNAKKHSNRLNYTTRFLTLSEKKRFTNLYKWQLQKPISPVCKLLVQLASMNVLYFV